MVNNYNFQSYFYQQDVWQCNYNNLNLDSTQKTENTRSGYHFAPEKTSSWHIVAVFSQPGIMRPLHFQKNLPEQLQCRLNVTRLSLICAPR